MPVVETLMDKLRAQYGKEKGERIYYSMEASARGPFAKGAKHYADHLAFAEKNGVRPVEGKKKPPAPGKAGGRGKRKVTRPKGPVRSRASRG